jgi:diaminohydroxyphosphoribosylaminopyrimidine deaminase/5-amino-6-(5-phosphoribosylamino)uracil reductase
MLSFVHHEAFMREAMASAEAARGHTGDNPWVGCVIVDPAGKIVARGFTRGPGEDHAEIGALRAARGLGIDLRGGTLYSTLEPCAFHGRTPACAKVVAECGVARLVFAMRDPHPRVDGKGAAIVREAGLEVIEGVAEADVRRQLAPWVLAHHPHDIQRRYRELVAGGLSERGAIDALVTAFGLDAESLRSAACHP